MSEVKIKVPKGMLKAVEDRYGDVYASGFYRKVVTADLEAALRWLAENPIVPTRTEVESIIEPNLRGLDAYDLVKASIAEWQRRMFLAPEPEAPKDVFRFHATMRRPATVRDDPSEREKELGIKETVLCVRASDYDNLLNLIQNRNKTSS